MTPALFTAYMLAASFVGATPSIEQNDWMSRDKKIFLAFRPGETDQVGEAWFIWHGDEGDAIPFYAYSGEFNYIKPNVVRMSLTRRWNPVLAQMNVVWWVTPRSYADGLKRAYAVDLEIESADEGIVVTVLSHTLIDSYAKPVSDGVRSSDGHFTRGQVITLSPSAGFDFLASFAPPGYEARDTWKRFAKENPGTITNANYFDTNWYGWSYSNYDGREKEIWHTAKYNVLSLRQEKEWSSGTAWLITFSGESVTATKGTFNVYSNKLKTQDVAMLTLNFLRRYLGSVKGEVIEWRAKSPTLDKYQSTLDIPLQDRSLSEMFSATLSEIEFVDDSGEPISKYDKDGFFSIPERRTANGNDSHTRADTFYFRVAQPVDGPSRFAPKEQAYLALLKDSPPPGFTLRDPQEVQTLKPVSREKGTGKTARKIAFEHYDANRFQEALAAFNEAIREEPKAANLYLARSHCHNALSNPKSGIADCSIALEYTPRDALAYRTRADLYRRTKQYAEAIADWERAIEFQPKNISGFNGAAWLLATCPDSVVRDPQKAIEYATTACELSEWKDPMILDTLAAAHAENGDFQAAIKWQKHAIKLLTNQDKAEYDKHLASFEAGRPVREE